jgi:hypothetical protein
VGTIESRGWCRCGSQDVVVTCAGDYGDEEGVLRWTKEEKTVKYENEIVKTLIQGLWMNDPVTDPAMSTHRRLGKCFSYNQPSSTKERPSPRVSV